MAAYCDFSGLSTDGCGHCRNGGKPLPPDTMFQANDQYPGFRIRSYEESDREQFGPWFTAQFGGPCYGCGDPVIPGNSIRSDGQGGWLCQSCGQ